MTLYTNFSLSTVKIENENFSIREQHKIGKLNLFDQLTKNGKRDNKIYNKQCSA